MRGESHVTTRASGQAREQPLDLTAHVDLLRVPGVLEYGGELLASAVALLARGQEGRELLVGEGGVLGVLGAPGRD